jgi:hypothetical protein
MKDYTFYDIDGKIVFNYSGQCISEMSRIHPELSFIIGTYDFEKYYILNDYPIERPIQDTKLSKRILNADGIDEIFITDAPNGIFSAFTEDYSVSGEINGDDSFSTNIVGNYGISIISFPYLDFYETVEAV